MAIGDVYRLRCVWKHNAFFSAINDFYFEQLDALVLDTPGEDLWQAFQEDVLIPYKALVAQGVFLEAVSAGKAPLFATEFSDETVSINGEQTGDIMPAVLCGVLSRNTALLTRRGRGRIFMPPTTEGLNTNGAPAGGYVAGLQALGDAQMPFIGGGVTTSGWKPVLWSPTDGVKRDITSWVARPYWGIQRDRRRLLI